MERRNEEAVLTSRRGRVDVGRKGVRRSVGKRLSGRLARPPGSGQLGDLGGLQYLPGPIPHVCGLLFYISRTRVWCMQESLCVYPSEARSESTGPEPSPIVFPALSVHGLGKACTCAVYYCCGSFRHRYRYFGRTGEKRRDGGSGERHRATYWTAVVPSFCRLNGN